jgi:arylsulfatase A-like enzyme
VEPRSSRPNFLFIVTDDLDGRLGTLQYMPHLQELMTAQGLTFDDFLISTPVCCPSRSSILRGQYAHNHQVYTNADPLGGFRKFHDLQNESSTLATWLQAAGYRTALFGKYLNGYPFADDRTYIPPGWSDWYSPARGTPYKEFNYYLNENGKLVGYGQGAADYMTDVLAGQVDGYLHSHASDAQPFFIYLSTYAPHGPSTPAPRHASLFPNLQVPRTPSFNEADVSDKPGALRSDPLLTGEQIATLDELYRQRVRSMQAVDEMIAHLIDTLQATGQLSNTYIFFTSDNGFHLGQHRLMAGKNRPYEEDIAVPLIIRGPGIPAGQQLADYLAGNIDIAPTIAELAGVVPPHYVDGRSLVPLWSASRPALDAWRQGFLIEDWGSDDQVSGLVQHVVLSAHRLDPQLLEPPDLDEVLTNGQQAVFFAVRTARYTYVEYPDGERELYDLKQDPYELNNLAGTADPGLLAGFAAWLKTLKSCAADGCRAAEQAGVR